jgi:ADP-ribose pyrophosphatase YjhB (NUDIX family)
LVEEFMAKERHKSVVAVYLIVIKDGKTLLYLRQNSGYCDGMYSLIAGHLEKGETIEEAMIREANEEAGMELEPSNIELLSIMHRKSVSDDRIDFFFKLKNWDGEIKNSEPEKCREMKFFDLKKMPSNTIAYVKKAIESSLNGIFFCEYCDL